MKPRQLFANPAQHLRAGAPVIGERVRRGLRADGRPFFRGRWHRDAFFLSLPAGILLVGFAPTLAGRISGAVYALSLSAVFGTSAAYHRGPWSERVRDVMQRLDHSMIYILIAGTYTPFCLVAIRGRIGLAVLVTAWVGALAGIALKMLAIHRLRWLGFTLYLVLGWVIVVAMPQLVHNLGPLAIALLVTGGLLYTAGAILFALHKPDPRPDVFGYHEVWHAMVVAAGACHYVGVWLVLRG